MLEGILIAVFFLLTGIFIGFCAGAFGGYLAFQPEAATLAESGKPTPEAMVEPSPEFLPEIEAPGPELTAKPPTSPDITQINVTLDPDFPIEEYMQMWFDHNYDVEKRKN